MFDTDLVHFFLDDLDAVFSGFDALWIGLAVYAAWRSEGDGRRGPTPADLGRKADLRRP